MTSSSLFSRPQPPSYGPMGGQGGRPGTASNRPGTGSQAQTFSPGALLPSVPGGEGWHKVRPCTRVGHLFPITIRFLGRSSTYDVLCGPSFGAPLLHRISQGFPLLRAFVFFALPSLRPNPPRSPRIKPHNRVVTRLGPPRRMLRPPRNMAHPLYERFEFRSPACSAPSAVRLYNNELFTASQTDGDVLALEPEPGYFSQPQSGLDPMVANQR